MNKKPRIGIIVGSNRPTRIARSVAEWVEKGMQNQNLELEIIDLAEINLPFLDEPEVPAHHHYTKEYTEKWSQLVNGFDGFVLVFPQYNWDTLPFSKMRWTTFTTSGQANQ